jgi:hypothetical protein
MADYCSCVTIANFLNHGHDSLVLLLGACFLFFAELNREFAFIIWEVQLM